MSEIIHASDLGKHEYLRQAKPKWSKSLNGIKKHGGPWSCQRCQNASLLCYRCSICGADLANE